MLEDARLSLDNVILENIILNEIEVATYTDIEGNGAATNENEITI